MKQTNLFGKEVEETEQKYTPKVEAPIYTPSNRKPEIIELVNSSKMKRLVNEINSSNASDEEKIFLIEAARRHNVFNYSKIADYYAHSSKEIQGLMEKSGLVIIDFEKAVQYGYVKITDDITDQYLQEYGDE